MGSYIDLLKRGLGMMELPLTEQQLEQLARYVSEIELFNPTYKLVGAEGEALIVDHIFDSLVAVPTIKRLLGQVENPRIADLGSGAGLPGIPLAIALSDAHFSLVERMQRRVSFLRSAVVATALTDRVAIIDRDLIEVQETFDLRTFRALHPLVDILESVAPLLETGGWVCAYKGQRSVVEAELAAVASTVSSRWKSELIPVTVPYLERERLLCLLQKL